MDLTSYYNLNPTELSGAIIVFNLLFAFVLQLVIISIYKKTRHGLSYSQSFIFTLIIVGTLSAAIMMAVQNNLIGAFAIFAAFTLIRFRTILKEPSDLAYVFFALVIGIASGMSNYPLALITVVVLSAIIYGFHRFGFGVASDNFEYLVVVSADSGFSLEKTEALLKERVERYELLRARYSDARNTFSFSLRLHEAHDLEPVLSALNADPAIHQVDTLTGKSTSEH